MRNYEKKSNSLILTPNLTYLHFSDFIDYQFLRHENCTFLFI